MLQPLLSRDYSQPQQGDWSSRVNVWLKHNDEFFSFLISLLFLGSEGGVS